MSRLSRPVRNNIEHFFGNDGRASIFIKLFLVPPFYTQAPDISNNELARDIITNRKYNNFIGSQDDTNYEFTDFIINTALLHKELNSSETKSIKTDIIQNIYNQFEMLDSESQAFYTRFMKYNNGQLELNKDSNGNILFSSVLPQSFGSIYATNSNNSIVKIDGETLSTIYNKIVLGQSINNFTSPKFKIPTGNEMFHVNYDSIIKNRLYKLKKIMEEQKVPHGPFLSLADKNIWNRDEDGKLFMYSQNGTRVYYEENDQATNDALKANFRCYSTNVNASGDECKKYLSECLINGDSNDISSCITYLKNNNFYEIATEDIRSMHPLVALRTLQKLGFRERMEYDSECGMNLKKVESCQHWIQFVLRIKPQFQTLDTSNNKSYSELIESNQNLLMYLELLVDYVNSNPAILNEKYKGVTTEKVGKMKQSELTKNLNIPIKKVPQLKHSLYHYDYEMLRSHLESSYTSQTLRNKRNTIPGLTFASPYVNQSLSFGYPGGIQMGGGEYDLNSYLRKKNNGKISGANHLYMIIMTVVSELEEQGVTIAQADKENIEKNLKVMMALESQLIETQVYLEEYKNFIDTFGCANQIIDMNGIKEIMNKQSKLYASQDNSEGNLMKTFQKLQNMLQNINSNKNSIYKPL